MTEVLVYTTKVCPYCVQAKQFLDKKGVVFQEIRVDQDPEQLKEMMQKSGQRTVPQIFIGDRSVGGFTDLMALNESGE